MKDINKNELHNKLKEIKSYYEQLSEFYSLKDELIESSKDEALSNKLNEIIDNYESRLNKIAEKIDGADSLFSELKNHETYFNQVLPGTSQSKLQFMNSLLSDENLKKLEERSNELKERYEDIVNNEKYGDITANILDYNEKINEVYIDLFAKENGKQSKEEELEKIYEDFLVKYGEIITGNEDDSISTQIDEFYKDFKVKHEELNKFYKKIFGSEDDEIKSLKKELEDRLVKLKEIEEEAKKVIALSSDAGLAGGFHQSDLATVIRTQNI